MKTNILKATTALQLAFEPGKPGWKVGADGKIEMKDGNPIYIDANGNESTVDGGTISRLNGEAKAHREAKEKAERELAAMKPFEGLNPDEVKKALDTVSKLDQKKLIDAGEVDRVREEISKSYTTQLNELKTENEKLSGTINNMTVDNAFNGSEFVKNRVAVPSDMFKAQFGKNFKIEDGKLVPYGFDGNKVYSKKRMGEIADFDEALEIIIGDYKHKDAVLKAPEHSGSGNNGRGGDHGGGRTVRRADYDKMKPAEQASLGVSMAKGEVSIVD